MRAVIRWPLSLLGAVAVALAGLAAWSWRPRTLPPPPGSFEVDPARYAGLWYEIGRTPNAFQDNRPRRDGARLSPCFETTASYRLAVDGTLAIRNRCVRRTAGGAAVEEIAGGIAVPVAGTGNRQLKIAFGPRPLRLLQRAFTGGGSDYWIFCLGDAPAGQPYPWAVVSGPKRDFLFLLARVPAPDATTRAAIDRCLAEAKLPAAAVVDRRQPPA